MIIGSLSAMAEAIALKLLFRGMEREQQNAADSMQRI